MKALRFCSLADPQQNEKCLNQLTGALFRANETQNSNAPKAFDEDESKSTNDNNKRKELGQYLRACRSNTISDESLLSGLLRENHPNVEEIKIDVTAGSSATYWICDMISSECLLMYISSNLTFLCNLKLEIYIINLKNENNFAKICVDSSNAADFTILSGSFMDKSADRKEFLIEDVLCYKSELIITSTFYERMQLIGKTIGNYRTIKSGNKFLFDFRGKPWIANNSGKGCIDFFKWYRQSSSTGNVMYHDGRHSENFSKGFMIFNNKHIPLIDNNTMLNFVYLPQFSVQIGLPIQIRHQHQSNNRNHHRNDDRQIGMTNKNGIVQDFNAMSNQSIQMHLRNDLEGLRTVGAIKAQFDADSMKKLIQISSTNTYKQWLLCSIIYNKCKSCYTLINTSNESKITNTVEKNYKLYNKLLIQYGSNSTVHSASDREKITLLTSSVSEFVEKCTKIIQSVTKNDIIKAFQSLSKPYIIRSQNQKKQHQHNNNGHNQQRTQQQQHHHQNRSYNQLQHVPEPPPI